MRHSATSQAETQFFSNLYFFTPSLGLNPPDHSLEGSVILDVQGPAKIIDYNEQGTNTLQQK